ncbi:MAG: HigA family addiction module antidote protein [Chlamydiia bacterium]|nr:HigA family addiction module antidote protein [Chlamydiia bacterium]
MLPKYRKPVHPGEILWEEFLKPLEISQTEFVKHLSGSWTQPKLSAIIREKRAITETIALDLADALGTSSEFWMQLQNDYNLWEAQQIHKRIKLFPKLRARVRSRKKLESVS